MAQRTTGWRLPLSMPGIYARCQNLLGGPRSRRKLVEQYIRPAGGMRILDLGCGPAMILDYLPDNIYYVGVDLSTAYTEAARNKYGQRASFYCLPVESMEDAGFAGFDLVMGLGVLHHLDDVQARRFFAIAASSLKENGRCLTVDPCRDPGQHPVARLLVLMDRGRHVRTAKEYAVLTQKNFPDVSQEIRHDRLRVPYTHHIMECRKTGAAIYGKGVDLSCRTE